MRLRSWASLDDRRSGAGPVPLQLGQQDPVSHQLDLRVPPTRSVNRTWYLTVRPSGVRSSAATRSATVLAASRRGWVCPIIPARPAPAQADLRQLGRLPRPGLRHHHDLMVADGLGDLAAPLADRELRRICDGGHGGYWGWSRMRRSRRVRWAASWPSASPRTRTAGPRSRASRWWSAGRGPTSRSGPAVGRAGRDAGRPGSATPSGRRPGQAGRRQHGELGGFAHRGRPRQTAATAPTTGPA